MTTFSLVRLQTKIRTIFLSFFVCCLFISSFSVLPSFNASAQIPPVSFADLVEKLSPAVVNISTVHSLDPSASNMDMPNLPKDSPFEEFFKEFYEQFGNPQNMPPRKVHSLGSGFIINAEKGLVVTNNHVVSDADEVMVILTDGTEIQAKILGQDPETDIALLKIDTKITLQSLNFGNSDEMRVGDWIIAIGNPFGLGGSVTAGIISARARDIQLGPYVDFLQTDAAINQGNSGGPMINMKGEVIGINTVILAASGGSIGIGFAIPSNSVKAIISQLEKYGHTKRGWIGVRIQDVTPEIAESLNLKKAAGVLIGDVLNPGPAFDAGMKTGDVVVQYNGKDILNMREFQKQVAETDIDTVVSMRVLRRGQAVDLKIKIAEKKPATPEATSDQGKGAESAIPSSENIDALGIAVAPLSNEIRNKFRLPTQTNGIIITKVNPQSAAAERGLKVGDIILEASQIIVKKPSELKRIIDDSIKMGRKSILLSIDRNGAIEFIPLPLATDTKSGANTSATPQASDSEKKGPAAPRQAPPAPSQTPAAPPANTSTTPSQTTPESKKP